MTEEFIQRHCKGCQMLIDTVVHREWMPLVCCTLGKPIYELERCELGYTDVYEGKYFVGDKFVNAGGILEIVAVDGDAYVIREEPKDMRVSMKKFDNIYSDGDRVPLTEYDGVKTEAEWAR